MASEVEMTYHVYQNWTVRKARVHFSDCSFCKHGKGIHPNAVLTTAGGTDHLPRLTRP